MATSGGIHVADAGTVLEFTFVDESGFAIDISAATTKEIVFEKPDATWNVTRAGAFVTDGTDGKLTYTTVAGDFDTEGYWQLQGHITTPAGDWRSDKVQVQVFVNSPTS